MEGRIEEYDRQSKKRKRGKGWEKSIRGKDFTGEGADIIIDGNARGKIKTGRPWGNALRLGLYAKALDLVLESKVYLSPPSPSRPQTFLPHPSKTVRLTPSLPGPRRPPRNPHRPHGPHPPLRPPHGPLQPRRSHPATHPPLPHPLHRRLPHHPPRHRHCAPGPRPVCRSARQIPRSRYAG